LYEPRFEHYSVKVTAAAGNKRVVGAEAFEDWAILLFFLISAQAAAGL
jgi:hypothetical protein